MLRILVLKLYSDTSTCVIEVSKQKFILKISEKDHIIEIKDTHIFSYVFVVVAYK